MRNEGMHEIAAPGPLQFLQPRQKGQRQIVSFAVSSKLHRLPEFRYVSPVNYSSKPVKRRVDDIRGTSQDLLYSLVPVSALQILKDFEINRRKLV